MQGDVENSGDRLVLTSRRLEPRLLGDGLRQGHGIGGIVGNHLRQAIDLAQRQLHHATDVPQDRSRLKRAEGDDLGDAIETPYFCCT